MDVGLLQSYADKGMTRKQIADAIGLSYKRTTEICRQYGIAPVRQKRNVKPGQKRGPRNRTKQIIALREQGLMVKEIMSQIGCSKDTVKATITKYGLRKQRDPVKIEEAISVINAAGYDYVCGFDNTHSKVTVRCRKCGKTFDKMYRKLREKAIGTYSHEMKCPHCWRTGVEEYRKKKREPKEREAQMKAQRRAEQLSRKVSEQLTKRLAIHVCKNCGTEFCIETTGYNSDIYCSKRCQQRWHDRIKNEKRTDRLIAREYDTDITLEKLFNRDGGVCYICGQLCDWSDITEKNGTIIAGNNYPSIDHVKPVSKGGTHTWGNIKLACRECNTLKGWK